MINLLNDIATMNKYLDQHPEDQETRAVLADAYEESGDEHTAGCLRLLVREGKYPSSYPEGSWDWFNSAENPAHNLPGVMGSGHRAYQDNYNRLALEVLGAEYLLSRGYTL